MKRSILRLFTLAYLTMLFTGCTSQTPNKVVWPKEKWEVSTPKAEGIDPLVIDSIHQDILHHKYGLIDEFLLIRHGKVVANHHYSQNYDSIATHYDTTNHMFNYDHPEWHPYYKRGNLHSLQSVTKSINSIAMGIAIDKGFIKGVEVHPMEMFKGYHVDLSNPLKTKMTLEDMLTMRSGLDWNEMTSYESGENSCIIMEKSDAWIQYVLSRPMHEESGTTWNYNSGVSMLLGKLVGLSTGKRVDEWTNEKLFKPIGITNYFWKTTPDNEVDTEGGLYLSSQDLARIGYLYLHKGKWENQQIVSQAWVENSIRPIVQDIDPKNASNNSGYGFQWWVPSVEPFIFACNGYGGQFVMVAPAYDVVVVFNGWDIHYSNHPLQTWNALKDRILPAIK